MAAQNHAMLLPTLLPIRRWGEVDEVGATASKTVASYASAVGSKTVCDHDGGDLARAETPRGHGAAFTGGVPSEGEGEDDDEERLPMAATRSRADSCSSLLSRKSSSHSASRGAREAEQLRAILGFELRERPPRILCVSRRHLRKNKYVDIVGEHHLDLVQGFGGVPVIIPRTTQTLLHLMQYLPMDGLLVAEGNDMSDSTLLKYDCSVPGRLEGEDAQKFASDTEFDHSKDELEFALMKFALERGCPVLGLCRGSQMLNVLRGGTLIGDIESEVGSQVVHLLDGSDPAYDSHRHPIHVAPGSPLAEWFASDLGDSGELLVNSYHHQGVKELGQDLVGMAWAPDGVLEGFYDPTYDPEAGRFLVGLQFHPERMLQDYAGCAEVYQAFGRACWAYQRRQLSE